MLQKSKSKAVWQLKYVLLLPLVLGMLVYTSCETETPESEGKAELIALDEMVLVGYNGGNKTFTLNVNDLNLLTEEEKNMQAELIGRATKNKETVIIELVDKEQQSIKIQVEKGTVNSVSVDKQTENISDLDKEKGWKVQEGMNSPESDGVAVPFAMIDEVPLFPGCEDALDKRACFQEKMQEHIRKQFRYPEVAQEQDIQGRVNIIFDIGSDGNIKNIRKRGPHELLENEAVRIIENLPKMQPGKQKGKVVDVPFSIPITFKLQGNDEEKINKEIQKFSQRGEDWVPFATIDEAPVFPGCENATDTRECFRNMIQEHIRKHFRYPVEAQEQGIQGRVAIMFTIDTEGNIVNINKRGPSPILEAEAQRILELLPKMQAGKQNGIAVDVPFSIPITFRLQ